MTVKHISIEDLRDLINQGKSKDPLVFLESVMNGRDPRGLSGIYELILDINDFCGGEPTQADWNEVVEYAFNHAKYKEVTLNESVNASKTLAEYLYAKRKQIDINGSEGGSGNVADNPLTEEEIELFKERFNDEF